MSEAAEAVTACSACGREFGDQISCQFCGQVSNLPQGVVLSSIGRRFWAYVLDAILASVTLFIGWAIWSLVIWDRGQTPAKQLLKMRTIDLNNRRRSSWGGMFLREVIAKWIGGFICGLTFGILYFMLCWDKNRQQIWDKFCSTVVVDDHRDQLAV
jgi:uncharacterized RDD family membrane protein YckC